MFILSFIDILKKMFIRLLNLFDKITNTIGAFFIHYEFFLFIS